MYKSYHNEQYLVRLSLFSAMRHVNLLLNSILTLYRDIFSPEISLCNGDLKFDVDISCFKDIYLPSYLKNIYTSLDIYTLVSQLIIKALV